MSYLVLARKYRPAAFASVSGQDHVTRTLANAIARNRVVHAYLFTGPRGVGKTSVSRILAKALNCQQGVVSDPCQECPSCKEIAAGTSLAVREIDGASHNSVDDVRDLIDSFKTLPPPGSRYKVYIIDEVHMLSISAFNALLKSLEEPPPNTVFILATTEVHKIPETVLSRCQRHDFRALSVAVIEARLQEVCRQEGISAEPEAITMIARLADGSMRDAQTLLDRVQTFCAQGITAAETSQALGSVERGALAALAGAIVARDIPQVLTEVAGIFATGIDPAVLLKEFTGYWREVFVAKLGGEVRLKAIGLADDTIVELLRLVAPLEAFDIQDLWDLAREGADRCMRSMHPRYGFESLVVRMASRQPVREIGEFLASLTSGASGTSRGKSAGVSASDVRPQLRSSMAVDSASRPVAVTKVAAQDKQEVADSSKSLDWEGFVGFVGEYGGRILCENLKRMRPSRFESGVLHATGPEFTISSLTREKVKLQDLLSRYAGEGQGAIRWSLKLEKGAGGEVGQHTQQTASAAAKVTTEALETHPALQSLQKVFPGSKVEQVKVRS